LIEAKIINATAYDLMRQLNISHVYVGSRVGGAVLGKYKWNSTIFLQNHAFSLVKNVGDAYLFAFQTP
jgi:hypothetical protein